MVVSKKTGLCINQEKTKVIVFSRSHEYQPNLHVNNFTFEKVENLIHIGVNIKSKNYMYREISERIASGNRCYHSKLLKSKLLSRMSKILLYTSYLRLNITYECEIWPSTKAER